MAAAEPLPALQEFLHPVVRTWFAEVFGEATEAQAKSWPLIGNGQSTLLLAPTGSGKTLAAFMVAINRLMFSPPPATDRRLRVLYISPLKALGVDVERNLRGPLAGVRAVAERLEQEYHWPEVGVRSGDTDARERRRLVQHPPDILITTPESLYLLLTSRARDTLLSIETVIIDEIHALAGTKRGAHLMLSLERLEQLRHSTETTENRSLQRIGLSATQRPLTEIARLLGGYTVTDAGCEPRPVEIVEVGRRREYDLRIEVPVEDMARLAEAVDLSGATSAAPTIPSIWPSIHPRLVELIRAHRSTMIFVNSRRLAERLAAAINETAEEEIALAHHGSIAKDTRSLIEDRLKRGQLPAIVATSSLELGIDMGAVDLVIQIEAPPSIASGMQRVGRSGHQVGGNSRGVIFPKFRGDLLACSAAVQRMQRGEVEETFYPRNPLDILAQQIVAIVAGGSIGCDEVFDLVRGAAPFAELPRSGFDSVIDLLSGRYPSDEFAELRPRLNWDRVSDQLTPRRGTQRLAVVNGGTIPDRGLYGVFLAGEEGESGSRVGELDEEMVFETRPGDVFLLGASSWRVLDVTHDRVIVSPAPGEPGRMPFWRGESPGRPFEFGSAIGMLARQLVEQDRGTAESQLVQDYGLDQQAATNLIDYLHDQREATQAIPSDCTVVVESFIDEVGDWRVCVLAPFGARVFAPWATAIAARLRQEVVEEVDLMWTDDGMVFRLPESEQPPELEHFFPSSEEIEDTVVRQIGGTALFATRFRENAARSLLLPRRQPGRRTPLWLQRRKSADLLAVATKYESFPILLETYRECLRDVFDLTSLRQVLSEVEQRRIRVHQVTSRKPSPFAGSLLFSYTGNFLYDGDTPVAERKAQALALDFSQLRELLGDAELRSLLDGEIIHQYELQLQRLDGQFSLRGVDDLHDLLRWLGDLSDEEVQQRSGPDVAAATVSGWLNELQAVGRVIQVRVAGELRWVAGEDAGRYRDGLGVALPLGLPDAFLEPVEKPLLDLISRFARTHGPFQAEQVALRFGLGAVPVRQILNELAAADRIYEGEFLPNGRGKEWCDRSVLRTLKQKSLAKLRREVEPVEPAVLGRFLYHWQGIANPRRGLDGILDVIEQLQGLALPASEWEQSILPARIQGYHPSDLDELCAAGEVVWQGVESIGPRDGRLQLILTDAASIFLRTPVALDESTPEFDRRVFACLEKMGAVFFDRLASEMGEFPNDILTSLWRLVWQGRVSNDGLAALRVTLRPGKTTPRRRTGFRSRRAGQQSGGEGRWRCLQFDPDSATVTERQTARASQLMERYGIVTRELLTNEGLPGGFSGVYPILKAMEESGRIRRGYFVAGQGAAQFASAGADQQLRRPATGDSTAWMLSAIDPANPFGTAVPWPKAEEAERNKMQRTPGAKVILWDGDLLAYVGRSGKNLRTFVAADEPLRAKQLRGLSELLHEADAEWCFEKINDQPALQSPIAQDLQPFGFNATSRGLVLRRR